MTHKEILQEILDTQFGTNGLELIETTVSQRGEAVETDWAITGFDSYEQATQFAQRNDMRLLWVDRHPNHKRWHRGDDYVRPLTIDIEYFGENHYASFTTLSEVNEFYSDVLKDSMEDGEGLDEAERIVKSWRECYNALDKAGDSDVVAIIHDETGLIGVYDRHPTHFEGDKHDIALAAILWG